MRRRRQAGRATGIGPLAGLSGFTDVVAIAAGGTSQVFRARQQAMDRLVAIKVVAQAAVDPRWLARYERELAVAGRLSAHPLFVTVHGHGVSDAGYPYLVMQWYEGGSLADAVERDGSMSLRDALTVGARVAAALAYLHGNGLVHRDVKPANVLLSTADQAVLADFGGVSRECDAPTATTVVSPLHVAPEVLRGEPATVRSDVWSLASTLWTVLVGVPPFAVAGPGGQLVRDMSRLDEPPRPPAGDVVPPTLRDLLMLALAPQPASRPSAPDLAERLRAVQAALRLPITDVPAVPAAASGGEPSDSTAQARADAAEPTVTDHAGSHQPPEADPTLLRRGPVAPPPRTWRQTVGLAAAGAVAGAVLAFGVLAAGHGLVAPDDAEPTSRPDVVRHAISATP